MALLTWKTKKEAFSFFKKVIKIGIDFKTQKNTDFGRKEKVFPIKKFREIPQKGKSLEEVLEEFCSKFLPHCINFASPNFLKYPYAGNAVAAIGADLLKSFLNQNLMTKEWSPAGTYIEIETIIWLRNIIGYKTKNPPRSIFEAGGISTVGGTLSNAIALYAASQKAKKLKEKNLRKYIFIPRGISHFSFKRSIDWLGNIGEIKEIEIKNFRYDLDDLSKKLKKYGKKKILAVIAFAVDGKTGSFDNFYEIYQLVKSFDDGIWLHADACHGFCVAFSDKLKKKLRGIELFDSISADPHKNLFTPFPLSFLLFKNPSDTKFLCENEGNFIQKEQKYDFGRITPFIGSKSWETLKFWFLVKNLGKMGIGRLIEKIYQITDYLSQKISKSRNYYLIKKGDFNCVLFSAYKEEVLTKIKKQSLYLLKFSRIYPQGNSLFCEKKEVIKVVIGNPAISKKDIDQFVDYLEKLAE